MSKPGPILPTEAMTEVKAEIISIFSKLIISVPKTIDAKYKNAKLVNPETVSDATTLSPILIGTIALGCNLLAILLFISLNIISTRMTLTPPPVDDEQPPTNISKNKTIFAGNGHKSKLVVEYPVVVIIEAR